MKAAAAVIFYHLPCLTPPCQASGIRGAGPDLIRLVPDVIDRHMRAPCSSLPLYLLCLQHAGLEDMAKSRILLY